MKNGNYILIYNTVSNLDNEIKLYNLEANIYNINNDLVNNFTIYENSSVFINFSVDNVKVIEDKIVVAFLSIQSI